MSVAYNTTLANVIIPKWDLDVLKARYANAVIMPRVLNKSALVKQYGDRVEINIAPKLSVGTVTASTGAFTPSASASSNVNIICNIWAYVADTITDQARIQAFWTAENEYPAMAGKAHAVQYDTNLANLHSSLTLTAVGDDVNPENFSAAMARIAMLTLANANIPLENLSWILPPIALYMGWMSDPLLTAANSMGVPKNVNTTGYQSNILGHPAYISTVLAKSANGSAYKAMLLHKEAIGIAMQKNNEFKLVDNAPTGALTHTAIAHSLYGVAAVRTDHGVVLNVKAS